MTEDTTETLRTGLGFVLVVAGIVMTVLNASAGSRTGVVSALIAMAGGLLLLFGVVSS